MYAILRRRDVSALTGKARSTLYADISRGIFPPPVALGAKSVGWPASEVYTINAARVAGKSDAEIKQLVADLVARRKDAMKEAA
jgi:prophage regulatory protein